MKRRNAPGRFLDKTEVDRALRAVTKLARAQGVPVALAGGLAMAIYGSPRLTADVDVLAGGPIAGLHRGRALSFGGYSTRVGGVPVDVIVRNDAYADLYAEALASARGGVVLPEHLAAMKLVAMRRKDEDDLLWLLEQRCVDVRRASGVVRRHLGAFGLDSFRSYVAEARWRRSQGGTQ